METLDINNLRGEFRTGKICDDGVIISPVGRLSYPALFAKKRMQDDPTSDPRFGAGIIFNQQNTGSPGLVDVMPVLYTKWQQMAAEYYGAKNQTVPPGYFLGLHDGATKAKDGYGPGTWYLSAYNRSDILSQIPVVGPNRQPLQPNQIKAGDFVRIRFDSYISKKFPHKGICHGLKSVQLVLSWEGFGASEDSGDEWGAVPVAGQVPIVPGQDW